MAFKRKKWEAYTPFMKPNDDKDKEQKRKQEAYDKEMKILRQYQGKDSIPKDILERAKKIGLSLEDQTTVSDNRVD